MAALVGPQNVVWYCASNSLASAAKSARALERPGGIGSVHRILVARHLALPHLAAILARCRLFVGHDSGISHLAAAVGAPSLLLFGPTDPAVWAPANPQVRVLPAPDGELARIAVETVVRAAAEMAWK